MAAGRFFLFSQKLLAGHDRCFPVAHRPGAGLVSADFAAVSARFGASLPAAIAADGGLLAAARIAVAANLSMTPARLLRHHSAPQAGSPRQEATAGRAAHRRHLERCLPAGARGRIMARRGREQHQAVSDRHEEEVAGSRDAEFGGVLDQRAEPGGNTPKARPGAGVPHPPGGRNNLFILES